MSFEFSIGHMMNFSTPRTLTPRITLQIKTLHSLQNSNHRISSASFAIATRISDPHCFHPISMTPGTDLLAES